MDLIPVAKVLRRARSTADGQSQGGRQVEG